MIAYEIADGVCTLQLNAPPLNALTPALLDELLGAIHRAHADEAVRAVVIAGAPHHFSAGADVNLFREITSPDEAIRLSQVFQDAFRELEDSQKPVAVALSGTVVGGALELAAACHLRIAAETARFRMPEVTLGIVPGAGGTQRLPRLMGIGPATKLLLTGETIGAQKALSLGLVDEVVPDNELLQRARAAAEFAGPPMRTRLRSDKVNDPSAIAAAMGEAQRYLAGVRPEVLAPWRILDCVRTGLEQSFETGLTLEQTGFAECMGTAPTRNKIHLFFATRRTGDVADLAGTGTRPITMAAVVGVGTMGTGIVQALAMAGLPVVAIDEQSEALDRAFARIEASIRKRAAQNKMPSAAADEILERVSLSNRWEDAGQADLVIEAVFENAEVKRSLIERLEGVCSDQAILATNTSTLSLTDLAAGMRRPERLIGLHFFNPAHRMPLVEVIRHDGLAADVLASCLALVKRLRKTPVVVKSREGFLVTRLFVPYVQEAFWVLEEGAPAPAIDWAMVNFGFPMGPLTLIDMTGLDILVHSQGVLHGAMPWHGPLSHVAHRLVESGYLGQKTGGGVYRYDPGNHVPYESPWTAQFLAEVRQQNGRQPREFGPEAIAERLVMRMVGEAYRAVEEGIVQCPEDIDVATVLGIGFPDFRGGLMRFAHDLGQGQVLARLDRLAAEQGERFAACQTLRGETTPPVTV